MKFVNILVILFTFCTVVPGDPDSNAGQELSDSDESNEYCITEVFKAECPENHVIVMRRSRYGRMRIGRCVRTDFGFVGCQADVRHVTDSRCSGRRRCSVRVADSLFEQTTVSGCNAELKFYLEATYDCVPVAVAKPPQCRLILPARPPDTAPRFIACASPTDDRLSVAPSNGAHPGILPPVCGSDAAPWLIEAAPGQQIRFTLHDFGAVPPVSQVPPTSGTRPGGTAAPTDRAPLSAAGIAGSYCHTYAVIREPPSSAGPPIDDGSSFGGTQIQSRRHTVCGRRERRSVVYRSTGNGVELRVTKQLSPRSSKTLSDDDVDDERFFFMIEYEAVGCANPPVEAGVSWLRRDGGTAVFGCVSDSRQRTLRCVDDVWSGDTSFNCTRGTALTGTMDRFSVTQWVMQLPFEVSVAVIVGLAFIVGLTIFVVGVILIQRRRFIVPKSSLQPGRQPLTLPLPHHQPMSDQRRFRGGVDSNLLESSSVGLLDQNTGGKCVVDNACDPSWGRQARAGSVDLLDTGADCRSATCRRLPAEPDHHESSEFYSSNVENEYAYVWDQPDSMSSLDDAKADAALPPPPYPYWRQESTRIGCCVDNPPAQTSTRQTGGSAASTAAVDRHPLFHHHHHQQQHHHHHQQQHHIHQHTYRDQSQQQDVHQVPLKGSGVMILGPQSVYETTAPRLFTTLDYATREPYCDIVNDGLA